MNPLSKSKSSSSQSSSTPVKKPSILENCSVSNQIPTPEKIIRTPSTRSRSRKLSSFFKKVKKVGYGVRKDSVKSNRRSRSDDVEVDGSDLMNSSKDLIKEEVKLIEKYEILVNFFNSMETSIRLLKLKSRPPTFPNICASIQNLTERRFTCKRLAQLKYILPEAIIIKKAMLQNPVTSCMYPDLHVSLQVDALDDYSKGEGDTGYSLLRRVFRDRVIEFSKRHPAGDDIPEDELPYLSSQAKSLVIAPKKPHTSLTMPQIVSSSRNATTQSKFVISSHFPPSFKSSFCQKNQIPEEEKIPLLCNDIAPPCFNASPSESNSNPPSKSIPFIKTNTFVPHNDEVDMVTINCDSNSELNPSKGTPAKVLSTPARLMTSTPENRTPKRRHMSLDCDAMSSKTTKKSSRLKLFNTPKKNYRNEAQLNAANSNSGADNVFAILPEALLQSIRGKERKTEEDADAGVVEAMRHEKLIACLPRTFDMIHLMFQAGDRSVMTKEELVHKMILNNCKIVDRGEVEEQLKLLQEIVPDWLSEKSGISGDILYSVDKLSSAEEIRERLVSAKSVCFIAQAG